MKKILLIVLCLVGLEMPGMVIEIIPLYQWNFNNPSDSISNSAPTYAVTPGTGNLVTKNLLGDAIGTLGLDGIHPMAYFTTNTNAGPGSINGAYVLNGQGYSSGNTAVAWATNLNIGSSAQFTLTYWVRFDGAFPLANTQLPRLVMIGAATNYDNGGANGVGSSINATFTPVGQGFQNGIGNSSGGSGLIVSVTNAFPLGGTYSSNNGGQAGLPEGTGDTNSGTWLFVAITYDSLKSGTNFITWVGTAGQAVTNWDRPQTQNLGVIAFSTNTSIFLGNRVSSGASLGNRALAIGALSDVRFYSDVLSQSSLDKVRQFQLVIIDTLDRPPVIVTQPVSGNTFPTGSRTFAVSAFAHPSILTYLWRSNGVVVAGGTNASLTISNVQASASGATFVCSITNTIGGTNTTAATLTVVTPVAGSYANAIYTNQPYSFWMINEASNNIVTIYDYQNGQDGSVVNPPGNLFLDGPSSSGGYPGFPSANTSIETRVFQNSKLNLGTPVNFPNTGMTICGWMRTPTGSGSRGIISTIGDAGGFGITHSGGGVSYQWGPSAPASGFTTGVIPNANEWTFVALVISTNLTADDIANSITADTNVTVYVGSHLLGLQSGTDSSALNGSTMANGTSPIPLGLGRTMLSSSENGIFFAFDTSDFNGVAVFYSALSAQTITNLYLTGASVYLSGVPDENAFGNMLLTYPLGTLQQSVNVQGTYNDVSGNPASPYSVPMTNSHHFYRVRD